MIRCGTLVLVGGSAAALGQIDPERRDLLQLGYNAAFEGHAPLSAYAFYYYNHPDFPRTNLTLRLALAPTYLDSELGLRNALGANTDLGIGIAGGGYADSYNEVRHGQYLPTESFDGYSAELNLSLYHLFNPGRMIPLNGLLRGTAHFVTFAPLDGTAGTFRVPDNMGLFKVRTGLRWGGREPTLFPSLAMELSAWYEGQFRTESDTYGFGDRKLRPQSHIFWGEAYLAYKLPKLEHSFSINLTAGASTGTDRLSAYRLGGFLPMVSEFPLSLPGYYYQELSAREFLLMGGTYLLPLDHGHRWNFSLSAATALVDYLPALTQPGDMNSGLGAGIFYTSSSWRVMLGYGYGIDAIRSDGRGGHSIGILLQLDFDRAKEAFFQGQPPGHWRGLQSLFNVLGS